jgi:hypothetical protein
LRANGEGSAETVRSSRPLLTLIAIAGLSILLPKIASAQELVAGWEGYGQRGYGMISPSYSFNLNPHSGVQGVFNGPSYSFLVRGSASYLYYQTSNTSGITQVTSPGVSWGGALRLQTRRLSLTFGPSYEVRWTQDKLPTAQVTHTLEHGIMAQGDAYFQATPLTNVNGIISYENSNGYLWSRFGVVRQVTNPHFTAPHALSIGAEFTAQGNNQILVYEGGGLFEIAFLREHVSLSFRGGYSRAQYPDNTVQTAPYLGVGLYFDFRRH